jgi:hypothetical protein
MKEERNEIKSDWDLYGSYATKALNVHERMQVQRDMVKRIRERPFSFEPAPLWHRDVGASERRVKELLSVRQSYEPFFVGFQDATASFDKSEKLVPAPKKTPQIRGRTFGFIFKE